MTWKTPSAVESNMFRTLVGAGVLTFVLGLPNLVIAQQSAVASQPPPSLPDVERLLSRARVALGGVSRLSAVESLIVEGSRTREPGSQGEETDPFGFKMLLPNRYQSLDSAYRHTIDGDTFWMDESGGRGEIPITSDILTVAARATRWKFIQRCLVFLLKVPDAWKAETRYLGAISGDTETREWIEVTASGFRFRIAFDPSNGLPSVVRETTTDGERDQALRGYRAVNGVLFPFTIDETGGGYHSVVNVATIKVNVGVLATDFKKK